MVKYFQRVKSYLRRRGDAAFIKKAFASDYYLQANPDVKASRMDPVMHYLKYGSKEGRNPTPDFNASIYLAENPDVRRSGMNPFVHYLKYGRQEGRISNSKPTVAGIKIGNDDVVAYASHFVQDQSFPREAELAEKILVVLIPEHNEMSGGIYSFFSIAKCAQNLRNKHGYFTIVMTRPNALDVTYTRQRNFRNSEDVFRFDQIIRCKAAKTVYLLIPEYATVDFVDLLGKEQMSYLRSRDNFFVNILNQKTDIMPEKDDFESLRAIASEITQSVAHHAYFGQKFADRYNLPMLLLPAYTDLSSYERSTFEDKENLIIYSPDDAPHKAATLSALAERLPHYELREIRGISFEKYMDLATRCRFSVTFGEGFDGYLAQPIHQGGIGFAVYNEEFFPSSELLGFENIFASADEMINELPGRIEAFESDADRYRNVNFRMINLYDSLYSRADYVRRVGMLINREFELYPLGAPLDLPGVRL